MPALGKSRISKETKAKAVAMVGVFGNMTEVARLNNISQSVVSRAAADPEIARMALLAKSELADEVQIGAQIGIQAIIADAHNAKFSDARSFKSLVEAMQLLRDEPTQISANVNVSVDLAEIRRKRPELSDEEVEAFARAKERKLKELLGGG